MERSDIRVLPSKGEATGHYFPDITVGMDFATLNPGYLLSGHAGAHLDMCSLKWCSLI